MRIHNYTSFPTETLKEIVAFVKPKYLRIKGRRLRVDLVTYTDFARHDDCVKNGMGGKAGWRTRSRGEYIIVAVPRRGNHQMSFAGMRVKNDTEWLTFIFAHEFQHVKQFRLGYVFGVAIDGLERDADACARVVLKRWRKAHAKKNK